MKKISENRKVTLTLKQLKKLIKESSSGSDWHWVVKEGEQSELRGEWIVEQLILHDNDVFKVTTDWDGWWVVCRNQDGLASGLAEIWAVDYSINKDDATEVIQSEDIEGIYNGTVTTAADGCLSIEKLR